MTRKSKRPHEEQRTTHLFRTLDQAFEDSNDSLDGFEQAAMRGLLCTALKDSECVSAERIDTLMRDLCPTKLQPQQCSGESLKDLDWDLVLARPVEVVLIWHLNSGFFTSGDSIEKRAMVL